MRPSSREAERIAELVVEVSAKEIMPRFSALVPTDIREKTSSFDLVTIADEAAERALTQGLARLYPQAVIIGEEATSANPRLLNGIADAETVILIDPIDGTKNFASQLPLFGTMIAMIRNGEVVASVIHEPVTGATAMAVRGEGAWNQTDDGCRTDLRTAEPVELRQMQGAAGTNFLPQPLKSQVLANLGKLGMSFWLRCAAAEYRLLAAGQCHFTLYNKLMPWDHAPGWLLHQEAGGYAAQFDGRPYCPARFTGGLLCTPDRESWLALHETLIGDAVNFA